jgi:Sugar kinases, ribokinase family
VSLTVYGEIGLDLLLDSNNKITPRVGGAGLYAAIVAAKQGVKVDFLTVYGPEIEQYSLDFWENMGISMQGSLYLKNYGIPRYIVTGFKAFENKKSLPMTDVKIEVNYSPSLHNESKGLLLFPLDHSFPESLCRQAYERNVPIFLDPKPNEKSINQAREILKYTTVLLVNEEEALLLSESTDINESIKSLRNMGPKYTIIKRGHKGCILVDRDKITEIPAYKSNVVCTLGSGDAFGGALAATLIETGDIEHSVQIGNCVAANFIESLTVETVVDKVAVEKDIHIREKFLAVENLPKKIYLAGPFFSNQEVQWVELVSDRLENAKFTVLSPSRENGIINRETRIDQRKNIFQSDIDLLNSSDLVVALLDHDDPGTCFEIGYAFGKGIPVLGLKTSQTELNNMIQFGCVQIIENIEDLIRVLYEQG